MLVHSFEIDANKFTWTKKRKSKIEEKKLLVRIFTDIVKPFFLILRRFSSEFDEFLRVLSFWNKAKSTFWWKKRTFSNELFLENRFVLFHRTDRHGLLFNLYLNDKFFYSIVMFVSLTIESFNAWAWRWLINWSFCNSSF